MRRKKKAKTVTIPEPSLRCQSTKFAARILLTTFLVVLSCPRALVAAQRSKEKPYSVIVGTVWGPDDRPVYGVKVKIRRATDKKPKWEVYSDHHGEFAQRLPVGDADYFLTADLKGLKAVDGKQLRQVTEVKVHIFNDEREDVGLHLSY